MDFLRSNFLGNKTLLSWTFPVIKIRFSSNQNIGEARIRFISNQNIGEGESNLDDWKCPT